MRLTMRRSAILTRLAALVLWLACAGAAEAQEAAQEGAGARTIVDLAPQAPRLRVLDHVDIIASDETRSTLDEARAAAAAGARAEPLPDGLILGYAWVRMTVTNPGEVRMRWRVDTRETYGDVMNVFVVRAEGTAERLFANDWFNEPFAARYPGGRRAASAPFDLEPGETAELWFDFPHGVRVTSNTWLVEDAAYLGDRIADVSFTTFLYGFRAALMVAIFAFAAVLRSRVAFYYGLFVAALYVFFLQSYGYIYAYVLRSYRADALLFVVLGAVTLTVFGLMARAFLESRTRYPRYDRALLGSLAFGWAAGALSVFLGPYEESFYALMIGAVVFMGVVVWGVVIGVRDRAPGARLFLVAVVFLIVNVSLGFLAWPMFNMLTTVETGYVNHAGFTIDAVLFAGALVSRALALADERDAAHAAELAAVAEKAALAMKLAEADSAHERAVALAEARRKQLAATSHDLKQPLLSLQMALKDREGLEGVSEGISYLEKILRRNLDETRPASAGASLGETAGDPLADEASTFALDGVLRNVALMFADEAAAKGVALAAAPTSLDARAEPVALMRVVLNLVANAVKHAERGRVLVGARRRGGAIAVQVLDTGPGMAPGVLERVFEPYVAGAESAGEGLGLSVVKELAEAQGWSLSARSEPGRGSVFEIGGIGRGASG